MPALFVVSGVVVVPEVIEVAQRPRRKLVCAGHSNRRSRVAWKGVGKKCA